MHTPNIKQFLIALLVSPLVLGGLTLPAAGQNVLLLPDDASRCTIFRALSAHVPADCQPRFRSIVIQAPTASVAAPAVAAAPLPQAPAPATVPAAVPLSQAPAPPHRIYAFATRIQFAFDSAQLLPAAYPLLDTLAAVLKDPAMATKVVRIEGHTDAAGSDAYNLRLSTRRALAVQHYLRDYHGLRPEMLPAIGKGESDLYDPARPTDPVNRRVQFVNLSESGGQP